MNHDQLVSRQVCYGPILQHKFDPASVAQFSDIAAAIAASQCRPTPDASSVVYVNFI